MKLFSLLLTAVLAVFLSIMFFSSCKTSKNVSKKNLSMIVLLKKKQDGSYFQKEYSAYNPSNVKKSNRTLNQYRVNFNCTEKEETELLKKLKDDSKVIEFSISQNTTPKIQSSKNQRSVKTSPIRKN